jgi:Flp pilus assembly protein TadG
MTRRQRGQSLVEFAFAAPLFVAFVFAIIQIGLIFIAYYSTAEMTLRGARWLAINHDATDTEFATYLQSQLLPGMVGGTPVQNVAGDDTTIPPTPARMTIGALTVTYTPCMPSGPACTNTNRDPGNVLFVQTQYDVSNWVFLPSSYNFGLFKFSLPTSLPTYRVYKMSE